MEGSGGWGAEEGRTRFSERRGSCDGRFVLSPVQDGSGVGARAKNESEREGKDKKGEEGASPARLQDNEDDSQENRGIHHVKMEAGCSSSDKGETKS